MIFASFFSCSQLQIQLATCATTSCKEAPGEAPSAEPSPKTKKDEPQAKQMFVKVKAVRGDWALVTGINEGDEVVTAGQTKLRNGSAVTVDNTQRLLSEMKPTPEEG